MLSLRLLCTDVALLCTDVACNVSTGWAIKHPPFSMRVTFYYGFCLLLQPACFVQTLRLLCTDVARWLSGVEACNVSTGWAMRQFIVDRILVFRISAIVLVTTENPSTNKPKTGRTHRFAPTIAELAYHQRRAQSANDTNPGCTRANRAKAALSLRRRASARSTSIGSNSKIPIRPR